MITTWLLCKLVKCTPFLHILSFNLICDTCTCSSDFIFCYDEIMTTFIIDNISLKLLVKFYIYFFSFCTFRYFHMQKIKESKLCLQMLEVSKDVHWLYNMLVLSILITDKKCYFSVSWGHNLVVLSGWFY